MQAMPPTAEAVIEAADLFGMIGLMFFSANGLAKNATAHIR
jgi:hypothetical protein